jgi:hypothetical protein
MTTDREVMQQALKALEAGHYVDPIFAGETEAGLRARLAEPETCKPALQVEEPVEWQSWWRDQGKHNCHYEPLTPKRAKELMKLAFEVGREAVQPARCPLTDEEIRLIVNKSVEGVTVSESVTFRAVARAVERAHKIGGNDD